MNTPVDFLCEYKGNRLFIKRDDLLPFCFGGNKARIAAAHFRNIDSGRYDSVVVYGGGTSNLCRVTANMAAARGLPCIIISPEENYTESVNSRLARFFGAQTVLCPVAQVPSAIERVLSGLRNNGFIPYFIPGGGYSPTGTSAYIDCYSEITGYETENRIFFDYIFHASGTGTTQSGLVCGALMNGDKRKIIGISIARENPRGRHAVLDAVKAYFKEKERNIPEAQIEEAVIFEDGYLSDENAADGEATADRIFRETGIALDPVYTAKAFAGTEKYISENGIRDKNILFIHTGGTPLFFDGMMRRYG